ncbi:hypothetical protein R1sor_004098 [Riccia sorocarpa]|uniref:Peptidase A1 domain-containing protein n=1 Tax=Riccia sorocarpa TaxID=122646 RepID=A0ABD3H5D2_9MARC
MFFIRICLSSIASKAAVYSTEPWTGRVPPLTEMLGADALQNAFPLYHIKKQNPYGVRGRGVLDSIDAHGKTIAGNVIQPSIGNEAEYYVKMQLGTLAQDILLLLDTGSSLFWTQCANCNPCVPAPTDANYDPRNSTTFKSTNTSKSISYVDGPFSSGNISTDTLTINSGYGNRVVFQNFEFLCTTNNSNPTGLNVGSGFLGMDLQSVFLVQLQNRSESIVFRYCFPNGDKAPNATSFLSIGPIEKEFLPKTDISGLHSVDIGLVQLVWLLTSPYCFPNGDKAPNATSFLSIGPIEKEFLPKTDINEMVYTPLRSDLYNLYGFEKVVLNLTGISVACQRLDIDINALNSPAILEEVELPAFNITILDSGTTFTRLPPSVVSVIQGAFNNATNLNLNSMLLDLEAGCAPLLCSKATEDQQFALSFPSLSYFFPKYGVGVHDEIEVVVPGDGMLIRYNNQTICLPICGVLDNAGNETVNIIDNRDQRNLLVEYDYEKLVVGFQRTVCGFEE